MEQPAAHRIEQSDASKLLVVESDGAALLLPAAVAVGKRRGTVPTGASAGSISEHDEPTKPREHAHLPRRHTPFPWQPSGHARPEQSAP